MSDWTIVVGDNAMGSNFPGNYNEKASTTAKPLTYLYNNETMAQTESINMGSIDFIADKFKD